MSPVGLGVGVVGKGSKGEVRCGKLRQGNDGSVMECMAVESWLGILSNVMLRMG